MSKREENKTGGGTERTLSDNDIVTRQPIGRRSALGLIGRTVVGGSALSLSPKLAAAQVADQLDQTRTGDTAADNDSGPNADPAGDTDITILADRAAGFDADAPRVGDTADNDVSPFADTGDNDVTTLADRKSSRATDPADIDISSRGDPLPAGIDVDPSDPSGDADQSVRADVADQD